MQEGLVFDPGCGKSRAGGLCAMSGQPCLRRCAALLWRCFYILACTGYCNPTKTCSQPQLGELRWFSSIDFDKPMMHRMRVQCRQDPGCALTVEPWHNLDGHVYRQSHYTRATRFYLSACSCDRHVSSPLTSLIGLRPRTRAEAFLRASDRYSCNERT